MTDLTEQTVAAANAHVRCTLTGKAALAVGEAGAVLFDAGGKDVLSDAVRESAREWVSGGVERGMKQVAPKIAARVLEGEGRKAVAGPAAMTAGAAAARSLSVVGKAGAVGAVLDAGFATVRAVKAVQAGEMTNAEARVFVLKEAGTGAAAGMAGVALATGAVALLGPLAPGVLFGVGALGSLGTKLGLAAVIA